jgi:hypothetical protein
VIERQRLSCQAGGSQNRKIKVRVERDHGGGVRPVGVKDGRIVNASNHVRVGRDQVGISHET